MLVTKGTIPKISLDFFKNKSSVTHYRVRGIKWDAKTLEEQEKLPHEVTLDIDTDSVNIYMESELEKYIAKVLFKVFGYTLKGWKTHCRLNDISKKIETKEEKALNNQIKRLMYALD